MLGLDNTTYQDTNYENPFFSLARRWIPRTMREVFFLCKWLYKFNGIFRAALDKIARIFFTRIKFDNLDETTSQALFRELLVDNLKFKKDMIQLGIEYLTYGNVCCYLYLPILRELECPLCKNRVMAWTVKDLTFKEGSFGGTCPVDHKEVTWSFRDMPDKDLKKANIIRIPLTEMEIVFNDFTGQYAYYWKVSSKTRSKFLKAKGTTLLATTPVEILQLLYSNKILRFSQDEILHLKMASLSGDAMEWGMPLALSVFPIIYYINVLRKANEAIAIDFIVPMRVVYPQMAVNKSDAGFMSYKQFKENLDSIIRVHKRDPTAWNVAPCPIGYGLMGGEKRSLMITDDIKMSNEELLNSIGFPAELFMSNMSLRAAPMGLRLFENSFDLTEVYNTILKWFVNKVSSHANIEPIGVTIPPLSWADNEERRQMLTQLAMSGALSQSDMLELYDMDLQDVMEKKTDEEAFMSKFKAKNDERMKRITRIQQEQGTIEGPNSVEQLNEAGIQIAQELEPMPDGQRQSRLKELGASNPALHDIVVANLERIRTRNKTQAYYQARGGI